MVADLNSILIIGVLGAMLIGLAGLWLMLRGDGDPSHRTPSRKRNAPPARTRQEVWARATAALFEHLHDGVFYTDLDGLIFNVNPKGAAVLGQPLQDLIGKHFHDIVYPEDRNGYERIFRNVVAGRSAPVHRCNLLRKDQVAFPADITFSLLSAGPGEALAVQIIVRDVTGEMEAVLALRESEQKLRALFESTTDAVFLKDLSGCYVMINPAGESMFQRSSGDILYKNDHALFPPDEAARMQRLSNSALNSEKPHFEEVTFTLNGEPHVLATTHIPYLDDSGQVSGVFGIIRDITQQKRTESELITVENRYRALFNRSKYGVLIADPDKSVVDASQQAIRLLEIPREHLIGCSLFELVPEDQRRDLGRHLGELATGTEDVVFEADLRRLDGSRLPVEISVGLVKDTNGRSEQYQIFLRDISERKRVDQERTGLLENLRTRTRQIQTAFEVSKSISSTLDLRRLLSEAVEIILQRFDFYYVGLFLVEGEEAVLVAGSGEPGRKMLDEGHSLPLKSDSMVAWCIQHNRARIAFDVGQDQVRFDNPLTPKTRSELALPLSAHGEVIGAITVQSELPSAFNSEDVAVLQIMADQLAIAVENAKLHEQVTAHAERLEQRVLERTSQLEAVNQELESFSYSVSHDLRAPLRAIRGFSNILMEDHGDQVSEEARKLLKKIHRNALRMGQLIDDILAFSRMGRRPFRKERVDPNDLIREVLEDYQGELSRRPVEMLVEPLPIVMGDRVLLKQVFANLIGNALKFTQKQDRAVIGVGYGDTDRGKAFFVQDNGVGFDMAHASRLFGVFQRLHHEDEFEGTGVGLAIVQRIVARHGGEIWCDAKEGEGATFYFKLG